MENKSGFTPLEHRLLVLPVKVETKTASGIVLATETTGREEMAQIKGVLVAVGEGCWKDTPTGDWAKPGDRIVFGKYSGLPWDGIDGEKYRILNDLDVVGREQSLSPQTYGEGAKDERSVEVQDREKYNRERGLSEGS